MMDCRRVRGVTLIELMIAMALALLLSGAAAMIAVNSKSVLRANAGEASLQDNARYAIDTLAHDLRMAGFGACVGAGNPPASKLSPAGYQYDYTNGLLGFHAVGSSWVPPLDASLVALAPPPTAGTEVLTVRTVTGGGHAVTALPATSTAPLAVDAASGFANGDIVLAANCSASVAFEVTSDPSTGLLGHAAGGNAPGNASADLGVLLGTDASVYRLVTRTYYLAPSAMQPGSRSLWVYSVPNYSGGANPQEIVEGVQDWALQFGEDTDADGVPNTYGAADQVGTWGHVIAVRVQLLMETVVDGVVTSPQPYTFNGATVLPVDRRYRSVMNQTVSLRNRTP